MVHVKPLALEGMFPGGSLGPSQNIPPQGHAPLTVIMRLLLLELSNQAQFP